jgi:hypothetical protein
LEDIIEPVGLGVSLWSVSRLVTDRFAGRLSELVANVPAALAIGLVQVLVDSHG